jgi:hypothetical protein
MHSNHNQLISQVICAAMAKLDALPGAAESFIADAASRDIANRSANMRLVRTIAMVGTVVVALGTSSLAGAITRMLNPLHIAVTRDAVWAVILVSTFAGGWFFLLKFDRLTKAKNLARLTDRQRYALENVQALARALPPGLGMVRENLNEVARRMLKIFPSQDKVLPKSLATLVLSTVESQGFRELATQEPCVAVPLAKLEMSLKAVLLEAGADTLSKA